jgi:serine protease
LFTGTRTLTGSFGADTFDLAGNYRRTVISGNGNIDFGTGARDRIDLSSFVSSNVTISLASTQGGGSFYDPGNGMRVFDSIRFNDGRYILFEGIDTIQFSDRSITLSIVPNDPKFNEQWSLGMMGVQNAWRFTTGSDKVMVGVTDTGIALTSSSQVPEDLQTFWYNPTNDYQDDFSGQDWGEAKTSHGTLVQSVISAKSNDEKGMAGINWGSDFYVVDSLGLTLEGGDVGDLTLSEATRRMAQFAAQRGQRLVVNMSLRKIEPEFELAVAANPNVLFVIASGNDGDLYSGLAYPASLAANYDNVIAVGAVWGRKDFYDRPTIPGTRIEYTDWWGSQYGEGLTLMGPSEVVALAATRSASGTIGYDYLSKFNGTSAATPNVTGVASLVWSANPNLSAKQVRQVLSQTATDLGAAGYDIYYGNGFVNADAAVRRAIAIGAGYA